MEGLRIGKAPAEALFTEIYELIKLGFLVICVNNGPLRDIYVFDFGLTFVKGLR